MIRQPHVCVGHSLCIRKLIVCSVVLGAILNACVRVVRFLFQVIGVLQKRFEKKMSVAFALSRPPGFCSRRYPFDFPFQGFVCEYDKASPLLYFFLFHLLFFYFFCPAWFLFRSPQEEEKAMSRSTPRRESSAAADPRLPSQETNDAAAAALSSSCPGTAVGISSSEHRAHRPHSSAHAGIVGTPPPPRAAQPPCHRRAATTACVPIGAGPTGPTGLADPSLSSCSSRLFSSSDSSSVGGGRGGSGGGGTPPPCHESSSSSPSSFGGWYHSSFFRRKRQQQQQVSTHLVPGATPPRHPPPSLGLGQRVRSRLFGRDSRGSECSGSPSDSSSCPLTSPEAAPAAAATTGNGGGEVPATPPLASGCGGDALLSSQDGWQHQETR